VRSFKSRLFGFGGEGVGGVGDCIVRDVEYRRLVSSDTLQTHVMFDM